MKNHSNRRRLTRKIASETLVISDHSTDSPLGTLVNITVEGMMLLSEVFIPTQSIYQLRIDLPQSVKDVAQVVLGAEALWSSEASYPGTYWTGFHITDITEADKQVIEKMIEGWQSDV